MVVPQSNKREQILKLIEEKDRIEGKINDLGNVLRAVSEMTKVHFTVK